MFNKFLDWLADRIVSRAITVTTSTPVCVESDLNRLTQAQYAAFEKKAQAITIVNSTTTELQAGYQLGVQHALKILREGWVV